jgi:hypothetical protein
VSAIASATTSRNTTGAYAAWRSITGPTRHDQPELHRHELEEIDERPREQAERDAAGREPPEADPLEPPRVVRALQRRLPRLAEEDHAVELHHHVARERRRERDERGAERQ